MGESRAERRGRTVCDLCEELDIWGLLGSLVGKLNLMADLEGSEDWKECIYCGKSQS